LSRADGHKARSIGRVCERKTAHWSTKRPGFNNENSKTQVFGAAVEFIGEVAAKHADPDYNDVKRVSAVTTDLGPVAANPTTQDVVGE
jgi:hypothetical protein